MYYGLTNYYQNHRRYVKSRDDNQLNGQETNPDSLSTDCKPYDKIGSGNESGSGFAPCGAIANSLFNGKLYLFTRTHVHDNITWLVYLTQINEVDLMG